MGRRSFEGGTPTLIIQPAGRAEALGFEFIIMEDAVNSKNRVILHRRGLYGEVWVLENIVMKTKLIFVTEEVGANSRLLANLAYSIQLVIVKVIPQNAVHA